MIMKSKFLKIAGVSSEKEFYKKFPTEESFFAAHPEAREMKKGGSMEAFPQTITADNFFSYGVPAPPNYLQKGGANNQAVPSSTYVNIPVPKLYSERPQPNPGEYTTIAFPDPDAFPGDSIRYFVGNQTPSGGTPYMRDLGNLFGVSDKTPRDIYKYLENPNLPEGRLYEDTLRIQANRNPNSIAYPLLGFEKKNKGGSLTNVPVFPQAQTEKQFFIPIYTNSPNAYANGGNVEAFPQAVSYPQGNWGMTNHFMLREGGTFPPGMPQYTGMLPVMQTGAPLGELLDRTIEDSQHYAVMPMQNGGQAATSGGNAALSKLQKFIGDIQQLSQNNLPKAITPEDEEIIEPAKYGGFPVKKFQGNRGSSQVPGLGVLQQDIYDQMVNATFAKQNTAASSQQANQQAVNNQVIEEADLLKRAKEMGHNSIAEYQASNWNYDPNHPSNKKQSQKPKDVPRSTSAPTPAPTAGFNQTTTGTTGTTGSATGTTTTTPSPGSGWQKVIFNGKEGYINPETNQFYTPYTDSGTSTTQQQAWSYDPMWVMPGRYKPGRITRGMDAYLQALAAGQIARGDVKLDKVRNRLIPGTGVRYMTFTVPGQTMSKQSPAAQAPIIQDPGQMPSTPWTGQTQARPMFTPEMIMAMNQGARTQAAPLDIDTVGPVNRGPVRSPDIYDGTNISTEEQLQYLREQAYLRQKPVPAILQLPNDTEPVNFPMTAQHNVPVTNFSENPQIRRRQETYNKQLGVPEQQYLDMGPEGPVRIPVGPVNYFQRYGGPFALPMYVVGGPGSILDENPFGGTEVMGQGNPDQQMSWNTGTTDQMNKVAREIEKKSPLGKVYNMDLEEEEKTKDGKFKYKPGRMKGPSLGPDAIMAMMAAGTNILEKMPWNQDNQDFTSALSNYGMPRKPINRGSYLTNDPGMGNTFRPDQYNPNMRGFYSPDFSYAQTGGQQFANMDSSQYYLTQEQINKVIKAGGKVPGF